MIKLNGGQVRELKFSGEFDSDPTKADTLTGKTHAELKSNIIAGLHRPGEKLRIEHLKRDYGVSSGTLREALTMLMADRLVTAEGRRGFRVKSVSAADMIDLNRIRILLEKEALRQSIEYGDDEWEAGVVSSYHLLSRATKAFAENAKDQAIFDDWERKHRVYHLSLISAAPSEWIRYFLTVAYQQYDRYRLMFHVLAQGIPQPRDVDGEHAAILDAVLARDADKAEALLEQHLTRTLDEWVAFFEKTGELDSKARARKSARSKTDQ